ncbi:uncharacterized protein CTRU02_205805 [Colletotrichum truncatum]|uniref:Uncharacterized protein n=1 Tax=Colletotrichum truncatum TaxID=5467 RepID=A0ACC3Z5E3_COLTU
MQDTLGEISLLDVSQHGNEAKDVRASMQMFSCSKSESVYEVSDSGYASKQFSENPTVPHLEDFSERVVRLAVDEEGDGRTTYSGASTIPFIQAKQCVSELSHIVCQRLGPFIDTEHWSSASSTISELIKAFAIRLGLESPSQANREIMCFVHKRVLKIADQIGKELIDWQEPTENLGSFQANKDSRKLLEEKMIMWERKSRETTPLYENKEYFKGVPDDEQSDEEEGLATELTDYIKVVTESTSLTWLVESLQREIALTPNTDLRVYCCNLL